MTYDFTATIENITPEQASALFDALTLLIAPYADSTAAYHEALPVADDDAEDDDNE